MILSYMCFILESKVILLVRALLLHSVRQHMILLMLQILASNYNTMAQLRNEIYDDNGLVRVEYTEVDEPTQEELIAQKEAQLLEMYEELKRLKGDA